LECSLTLNLTQRSLDKLRYQSKLKTVLTDQTIKTKLKPHVYPGGKVWGI
jgi:hypothetical protein